MKIEKIEKVSKEIKQLLNNIDAIGIYYEWYNKHKPLEVQLSIDRFLKLFKNNIKKAKIEIEEDEKRKVLNIKYFKHIWMIPNNVTIIIYINICKVKYFAFANDSDIIKIRRALYE